MYKSIIGNGQIHHCRKSEEYLMCESFDAEQCVTPCGDWMILMMGFINPGIALLAPYIR